MRVGIMKTDFGPHPAGKWAEETAGEIMSYVQVAEDSVADTPEQLELKRVARRNRIRLEADIIDIVEPLHHDNIVGERDKLKTAGDTHLETPLDADDAQVDAAVEGVVEAAKKYGQIFSESFDSENGRAIVKNAIKVHFVTAKHIERSYHVDRKIAAGDLSHPVREFHRKRLAA